MRKPEGAAATSRRQRAAAKVVEKPEPQNKSRVWAKQSLTFASEVWKTFGFNEELLLPTRENARGTVDLGLPVDVSKFQDKSDAEEAMGEFADGTTAPLGITLGDLRMKARETRSYGDATLYEREHKVT